MTALNIFCTQEEVQIFADTNATETRTGKVLFQHVKVGVAGSLIYGVVGDNAPFSLLKKTLHRFPDLAYDDLREFWPMRVDAQIKERGTIFSEAYAVFGGFSAEKSMMSLLCFKFMGKDSTVAWEIYEGDCVESYPKTPVPDFQPADPKSWRDTNFKMMLAQKKIGLNIGGMIYCASVNKDRRPQVEFIGALTTA